MIPGVPRFRWPAFSVRISPIAPYITTEPNTTARTIQPMSVAILSHLLIMLAAQVYLIIDKKFTSYYKEQNQTDDYF